MKPVLILGAGINGTAVARDLAINGIPVCLVDTGDIARGATSRSSRLIHGGLRYLEYRDIELVRESLHERDRLLRTAPQFVRPLRLTIPVTRRLGGLWAGLVRFSGLGRTSLGHALLKFCRSPRGLLAVQLGLAMYDWLAQTDQLPGHEVRSWPEASTNDINLKCSATNDATLPSNQFRWVCSYSDAQIEFPERFALASLEDGRRAAQQSGTQFDVLPYHRAVVSDSSGELSIQPLESSLKGSEEVTSLTVEPSVIINATGAWGDRTLEALGLQERQYFAGTKGSHLFTCHRPLVDALSGKGIYAEADGGRMVFILPCAAGVLIGTTDDPYSGDPGNAVSSPDEIEYLLKMVNRIFPVVELTQDHISMHHAGIRPLPHTGNQSAASVPRGHSIEESRLNEVPILTLVGGKLTTCRSLAEEVCSIVCRRLSHQRNENTVSRLIPGADDFPLEADLNSHHQALSKQYSLSMEQVETVWKLIGNRFDEVFGNQSKDGHLTEDSAGIRESIFGTAIPREFVRWTIEHEWCTRLEDVVERRLMLIFESQLHRRTLQELGLELVHSGRLKETLLESEIESVCQRMLQIYGKTILSD